MSQELFENVRLISSFLVIVPLLLSRLKLNKLNHIQIKLSYLLVAIFIVEFISNILWYKKINNLPLYHFYTIIEFLLIVNIYRLVLSKIVSKAIFMFISIAFVIFAIFNTLFLQSLNTFNSNTTTVMGFLVIFFSLSYYYALLKEEKYHSLESNPMFWINSGFLIYFSSNLILFFMNNSLFKGITEASRIVWGLHAVINIVLTIFYTIALWVNPKER